MLKIPIKDFIYCSIICVLILVIVYLVKAASLLNETIIDITEHEKFVNDVPQAKAAIVEKKNQEVISKLKMDHKLDFGVFANVNIRSNSERQVITISSNYEDESFIIIYYLLESQTLPDRLAGMDFLENSDRNLVLRKISDYSLIKYSKFSAQVLKQGIYDKGTTEILYAHISHLTEDNVRESYVVIYNRKRSILVEIFCDLTDPIPPQLELVYNSFID